MNDTLKVVPLCTASTPVALPARPLNLRPSRKYVSAMQRVSIIFFSGNFKEFLMAKTAQERREIEAYLKADGPDIDWTDIDDAMLGWALTLLGEDGSGARPEVVNLH